MGIVTPFVTGVLLILILLAGLLVAVVLAKAKCEDWKERKQYEETLKKKGVL